MNYILPVCDRNLFSEQIFFYHFFYIAEKYLEIKKQIEAFHKDHLDWLESNLVDVGAACNPLWFLD